MAWIRCTGNTGGSLKVRTASGAVASFETNLPEPLQSVIVDVKATGGNGTPDNPNPINGYSEANITRCGVNLFDVSNINDTHGNNTLSINGNEITMTWVNGATVFDTKNKQIFKAGNYIIKGFGTNINKVMAYFYKASDNTQLTNIYINTGTAITLTADFYIAIGGRYDDLDTATFTLQLEADSIAHDYSPYNGQTYAIAFGQTVYGGQLIITPDRTYFHVMHKEVDLDTLTWITWDKGRVYTVDIASTIKSTISSDVANIMSEKYHTVSAISIATDESIVGVGVNNTNVVIRTGDANNPSGKLVYELATPFDIDLSPEVISAIVGTNNVFHDCNGDTEVKYLEVVRN